MLESLAGGRRDHVAFGVPPARWGLLMQLEYRLSLTAARTAVTARFNTLMPLALYNNCSLVDR
jgi:hypothetical protein